MSEYTTVQVERDTERGLAVVRMDNGAQNTLTLELLRELRAALEAVDRDGDVDAIVFGTAREVFSSGANLQEVRGLSQEAGSRWLTTYMDSLDVLQDTGKPTIAAVEGTCVGGGHELVLGCDLIVAGESARLGQPEVFVGSTGAFALMLLPLIVGEKRAREMMLTGALFEAPEAKRMGLVNRVVEDGTAEAAAADFATEIVERSSPQAYRVMKSIMKGWTNLAMHNREVARELTASIFGSEEFTQRVDEFLEDGAYTRRPFMGVRPETGADEPSGDDGA
jgi:enoyl-CoA hydratase/carnithine racemase